MNIIHLNKQVTYIRNKYGFASMETIHNLKNVTWIVTNLNTLAPPDVALLAEYERELNLRSKILERFESIMRSEDWNK